MKLYLGNLIFAFAPITSADDRIRNCDVFDLSGSGDVVSDTSDRVTTPKLLSLDAVVAELRQNVFSTASMIDMLFDQTHFAQQAGESSDRQEQVNAELDLVPEIEKVSREGAAPKQIADVVHNNTALLTELFINASSEGRDIPTDIIDIIGDDDLFVLDASSFEDQFARLYPLAEASKDSELSGVLKNEILEVSKNRRFIESVYSFARPLTAALLKVLQERQEELKSLNKSQLLLMDQLSDHLNSANSLGLHDNTGLTGVGELKTTLKWLARSLLFKRVLIPRQGPSYKPAFSRIGRQSFFEELKELFFNTSFSKLRVIEPFDIAAEELTDSFKRKEEMILAHAIEVLEQSYLVWRINPELLFQDDVRSLGIVSARFVENREPDVSTFFKHSPVSIPLSIRFLAIASRLDNLFYLPVYVQQTNPTGVLSFEIPNGGATDSPVFETPDAGEVDILDSLPLRRVVN
ncbi:MAG: hypothetical protein COT74_03750 [Bdellovibrionales bacterium CG10_big_fil_rev_8_21_14_0_10_45_34]|nr:MAG: hypothetical protein COT74_03750 [Bdellovibrionales bacterium CG10_big_fil_rev_8_21_14_0_10_45_34]